MTGSNRHGSVSTIRAGFIPLLDAAPVIVAREMGFAEREGLDLILTRETSWATLRDRLAVSQLDVAHVLAPLPIATNLGLAPLPTPLVAPMALGFGGNTVTLSTTLWQKLVDHGASADFDPRTTLSALTSAVAEIKSRNQPLPVLAIVHRYSAHHYELAYWLATGGLIPRRDVQLVVLPPSLMPSALASGHIDGFCAGEPWGSVAAATGAGVIATTKSHIWRSSPEKVLAVRRTWAEGRPAQTQALVRAIYAAAVWCDADENRAELAALLARPDYLALDRTHLLPGLSRVLQSPDGSPRHVPGFLQFAAHAATFPWTSHALWFLAQMARWSDAELTPQTVEIARSTFRPDIYRAALAPMGIALPSANAKVEGALTEEIPVGSSTGRLSLGPDGFFDGRIFDPEAIDDYVTAMKTADVSRHV
ncbi:MAG: CmpA/NrtA family ABC transporter substrate-binding protein [Hyphomicrobiaceae bacterium]